MSSEDQDYRAIRDAMERLLKGEPIGPDASLTAVALAAESRVPRWKIYDEYRDLLDEFRIRAARQGNEPRAIRDLLAKHAKQHSQLKTRYARNRDKLAQSVATVKRLSCIVNVLVLENTKLKKDLGNLAASGDRPDFGADPDSNVTPIDRAMGFRHDGN